ncbi:MAG: hypothetical protein GOV02_00955 [Candidatus Aenigmarchaeota archaeon]|nr:hypothetical protein [Candidatus Aenigmarchaeota archaeon]
MKSDNMKGATGLPITVMILLVLGVLVLIVVSMMVLGSTDVTSDIADENNLINCCRKYIPECDTDVVCSADTGDTISVVAGRLGVDPFDFCNCG